MLTVACVLKAGPEYTPAHVYALRDGVRRHLSLPHRFVCLTDMAVECERIPLRHGWPGWFSKIELFSGSLTGPVLYFDLDTIIVGKLDVLAVGHRFTVLQNFWSVDRIGSGMMAWDCDLGAIYERFAKSPEAFMRDYKVPGRWGDQAFIKDYTPIKPDLWQRKFPGKVISYKFHVRETGHVPKSAAVCCFHGQPRPWQTPLWNAAKAA